MAHRKAQAVFLRFLVLALLALARGAPAADGRPAHVLSLNLCTDALLLDLVPPERIASVTYLSRSYAWLARQAARVPVNRGSAEDVLAAHPDLVLASSYTPATTLDLLRTERVPLLIVPPASDFLQIRQVTRLVARAVGEEERGEQLLTRMDAMLQTLSVTRPKEIIRVVGWDGGGVVPGRGTLFNAILEAAGGVNIGALPGLAGSYFGIERLLISQPDVLAYGADSLAAPSLRRDAAQHPLILARYAQRRIMYPELLYSCGMPESADAARALREQLLAAMRAPGPAP